MQSIDFLPRQAFTSQTEPILSGRILLMAGSYRRVSYYMKLESPHLDEPVPSSSKKGFINNRGRAGSQFPAKGTDRNLLFL